MTSPSTTRRPTARTALMVVVALLAVLVGAPAPARAFTGAFFPTQSTGNRGVDVETLQYLLQQRGFAVPADGVYGASTEASVRAFQVSQGLGADGVAGPATWTALSVTVRQGSTGAAVRALQRQLIEKHDAWISVSGTFDAATHDAVVAFQRHAGLTADGIVGATTWKNLLWHYDYPYLSSGLCDQSPDGNGDANWGTGATIGQLEEAGWVFAGTFQGEVPLGDVSFEHGGDIPGHASHEVGLDADLWPIRTDDAQCTGARITWRSAAYDRDATRQLVRALRDTAPGHVKAIWFNDPVLVAEGLTSTQDNHDNHLHIRYCERVHPNPAYRC